MRWLFDWFFQLLFRLEQGLLLMVELVERIFDVFAGISKISYNGQKDYLLNVIFGQSVVTTVFWGMTGIAIALCIGFTIVSITRKTLDYGGTVKNSVGQILTNAMKAVFSILLMSFICITSINMANVLLVQVNYLMKNANTISKGAAGEQNNFSTKENAAMTRIINTIANYSLNASPENRYNINACYNEIRTDLYYLHTCEFFNFEYPKTESGHTWQSAIFLIGEAADITQDAELGEYSESLTTAIITIMNEITYNPNFRPIKAAGRTDMGEMEVDNTIFLISSMDASWSKAYRTSASFTDGLRRAYLNGSKSYKDMKQVRKDFDLWNIRYEIAYAACILFLVVMVKTIFTFIMRIIDLLILYLVSPLFISTMPLDDGEKFQAWRTSFVIKLFTGYGSVVAMRLYLMLVSIIMDSKLVFFEESFLNYMCQLLFILGGAYGVFKATTLITNVLSGSAGAMAANEMAGNSAISRMGHGAVGGALGIGKSALGAPAKAIGGKAKQGASALGNKMKDSAKKSAKNTRNHIRSARQERQQNKQFKKDHKLDPAQRSANSENSKQLKNVRHQMAGSKQGKMISDLFNSNGDGRSDK